MNLRTVVPIEVFEHEGKRYLVFDNYLISAIPGFVQVSLNDKPLNEYILESSNPYVHRDNTVIAVEHAGYLYIIPRLDHTSAEVIRVREIKS